MVTKKSEGGTWVTITDVAGALDAVAQSAVEGERRLMIAVLAHALRSLFHDAAKPGRGAARRLQQDLRWLTSSDRDDPFAFVRVNALGPPLELFRSRLSGVVPVPQAWGTGAPARSRASPGHRRLIRRASGDDRAWRPGHLQRSVLLLPTKLQTGFGSGPVNSISQHWPLAAMGGETTKVTRTGSAPTAIG